MYLEYQYNFGDRLKSLMASAGINPGKWGSATALAKAMVDQDCAPLDNIVKKNRKTTAKSAILRHMATDSAEKIEGRWIKAYCDFFGCSADYLFGYISEPTHQKTDISEYTGLTEESIEHLHQISQSDNIADLLEPLNFLLEDAPDGEFGLALHDLTGYKQIYKNSLDKIKEANAEAIKDSSDSNADADTPKSIAKAVANQPTSRRMKTAYTASKEASSVIKAGEEEDALMYNVHRHFEESSKNFIQMEKEKIDESRSD